MLSEYMKGQIKYIQDELTANPTKRSITIQSNLMKTIIKSLYAAEQDHLLTIQKNKEQITNLKKQIAELRAQNHYYKKRYKKDLSENFKDTGPKKKS